MKRLIPVVLIVVAFGAGWLVGHIDGADEAAGCTPPEPTPIGGRPFQATDGVPPTLIAVPEDTCLIPESEAREIALLVMVSWGHVERSSLVARLATMADTGGESYVWTHDYPVWLVTGTGDFEHHGSRPAPPPGEELQPIYYDEITVQIDAVSGEVRGMAARNAEAAGRE